MSHEITQHDHLVLTGKPAWHGLGTVVSDAPSAVEALKVARLDWTVEQWPLTALADSQSISIGSHVLNVRGDIKKELGVVGSGYRPVQNHELAAFVDSLSASGQVEIESAGSIRGGKRLWFLVRGESVWVGGSDEVRPYLLVANGHDGTLAVTCQPTTVRVVCKNTLHASLKQGENAATTVRFRHEGVIADKFEDAKRALGIFSEARNAFEKQSETLNAREMSREDLTRYWLEVYTATIDVIPATPITTEEKRRAEHAKETLAAWADLFDRDRANTGLGPNAWTALNAVTNWFDHRRTVRAPHEQARAENRVMSNLWGPSAAAKSKAFELARGR